MRRLLPLGALAFVAAATTARGQCPDGRPVCAPARIRSSLPPAAAERGRRFLILPFRNLSRGQDQDWLVEGSTTMIGESLGRWREITVVPDDRLYPALRRQSITPGSVVDSTRVRRLAEETGGWTAVTGEIVATGGRVTLSARAYDVVTNRPIVSARAEVRPGADVRTAFEGIATRLLHAAGLDTARASIAAGTTRSLDAYRAYLRGMSHVNRVQFVQARDAFGEAIRLDSAFAQAYFMLVEAALFASPFSAFEREGAMQTAMRRSIALADHFSPADRELILGVIAMFQGRLTASREVLERRSAADPDDVRAHAWLGFLEFIDGVMVTDASGTRRRGSMAKTIAHARRILALDPARHDAYLVLSVGHLFAAGAFPVVFPAYAKEAESLEAFLLSAPTRFHAVLLRNSIEWVPAESLSTLPRDSLAAWRRRALDSAAVITNRWLAAGPTEGVAHHLAAEVSAYSGDIETALAHIAQAEALGTEYGGLDTRIFRLVMTAKQGRYGDARLIERETSVWPRLRADFGTFQALAEGEGSATAFNLYLMWGEYAKADTLLSARTNVMKSLAGEAFASTIALQSLSGRVTPPVWLVAAPLGLRMDALDSAWARSPQSAQRPNLQTLARLLSGDATAAGVDPSIAARARRSAWFVAQP